MKIIFLFATKPITDSGITVCDGPEMSIFTQTLQACCPAYQLSASLYILCGCGRVTCQVTLIHTNYHNCNLTWLTVLCQVNELIGSHETCVKCDQKIRDHSRDLIQAPVQVTLKFITLYVNIL